MRPFTMLQLSSYTLLCLLGSSGCATERVTDAGVDPAIRVVAVTVSPKSDTLQVSDGVQLTVTVVMSDNSAPPPANWASANPSVAFVTSTGMVTALAEGSARIRVSAVDKSDSALILVVPVTIPVASVEVTPPTASIDEGKTVQLTAVAKDASGNPLPGRSMAWSSSNTAIARVTAAGLVTGVAVGSAYIVAMSGGKSDTASVTVTRVPVASVDVAPSSATVAVGRAIQLQATVRDSNGTILSGRVVSWTSSSASVASVSSTGLVTGVAVGSATVTATSEGKIGSSAITVTAAPDPPAGECASDLGSALYPPMPRSTGDTFYISPSGSDSNAGTLAAPWKTLQKAFDTLLPGQIAYLRAGTYGAFCSASTFRRAGTASAPITVQGYPGERAVLHGQIRLEGSYFRLSNVVVEGPTCGTWGASSKQGENMILMVPGKSHHIEVSHSEVYHGGWHAGVSAGGDDIWILNNYIHDNGGFNDPDQWNTSHGIYYHDGTRGVVANNILEHNRAKGLSARYSANHILVVNNTVVGNGRSGIDITDGTYDWTFANNIIMNNGNVAGGVGIHTSGSSGGSSNVLRNNVFWNNGTSGSSHWDSNSTRIGNAVADPLFVNPVGSTFSPTDGHVGYTNDYHLKSGSPALDFGSAPYAPRSDMSGVCRPQGAGPDAGVYER